MDIIQGVNCSDGGLRFATVDITVLNQPSANARTLNQGECVYISFIGASGATGVTSSWATGPVSDFGGTLARRDGFWGVVLDTLIPTSTNGRVRVKGPVKAILLDSTSATGAVGPGVGCVVFGPAVDAWSTNTVAERLDLKGYNSATVTRKIMAVTLENTTSTASTSAGTVYGPALVLFDGINGFGGAGGE